MKILFLSFFLLFFTNNPVLCQEPEDFLDLQTAKYQTNLGNYHWQKGDYNSAIAAWEVAERIYRQQGNQTQANLNILQISAAYTNQGKFTLAIFQLEQLLNDIKHKDSSLLAKIWQQLGDAYNRSEQLSDAVFAYERSLDVDTSLSTLNNLVYALNKQHLYFLLQANSSKKGQETERYLSLAQEKLESARANAKLALSLSAKEKSLSRLRALINWSKLDLKSDKQQIRQGRNILAFLPNSRDKVFLLINWAKIDEHQAHYWLEQAVQLSQVLDDPLAQSEANLHLALSLELNNNFTKALEYASNARIKADLSQAYGTLYEAEWLLARIYQQQGKIDLALNFYRSALDSLDSFSRGSEKINIERRLNFSSEIEPIYRSLLSLLLDFKNPSPSRLHEAKNVFARLRLAQLQNYFGDNCFDLDSNFDYQPILQEKNSVLLSSILLPESTHFILQLPDGTLVHQRVNLSQTQMTNIASSWYSELNSSYNWNPSVKESAKRLYDIIIRPFEKQLELINPNTVIFVHDGVLRNIPMAALFDGSQFFVQKWASVNSLGLNFIPTTTNEPSSEAIGFAMGVKLPGWSQLDFVEQEVDTVVELFGGSSIINHKFTADNFTFQLALSKYSKIHIATHGYFGGVAENSFIRAIDGRVNALDLYSSLSLSSIPIDLLVFSACETAISSEFSVLGLAGVALRTGVDSVLGSFWLIQDDFALSFFDSFYSYLKDNNLEQEQAFRQVQLELIDLYSPPVKWAALTLFDNWQFNTNLMP